MNFIKLINFFKKNKLIFYFVFFIFYFLSFYFDELNLSFWAIVFNNLFLILFSLFFLNFLVNTNKKDIFFVPFIFSFVNGIWLIFLFKYINFIYSFLGFVLSIFILSIFWYLKLIFFYFISFKIKENILIFDKFSIRLIWYIIISIFYSFYYLFIEFIQYNLKDLDMSFIMTYFTQSSNYFFFLFFKINPFLVTFIFIFLVTFFAFIFFELFTYSQNDQHNYKNNYQSNYQGNYKSDFQYNNYQVLNLKKQFLFIIKLFFVFYLIIFFLNFIYFKSVQKKYLLYLQQKLIRNKVEFILIQTDIDSYFNKFNQRNYDQLFKKLKRINIDNTKDQVVIIPEGALIKSYDTLFYLDNNINIHLINIFKNYLFNYLIFNTISLDSNQNLYNSLVLFDKRNSSFSFYLKRYLVPFGEYYPDWFLKIFKNLDIENLKYKFYTSGFIFKNNNTYFKIKDINFKVFICFESFKYKEKGSNVDFILVSSNDMWFKNMFMDSLHLKSIKILSIYNLLPIIFNANGNKNGVIFIFDFVNLDNIKIIM